MAQAPLYPDFPKEEFDNRYARARQMMAEEGLDALMVTAVGNYEYFTGHRSDQNHNDKIRPYVFLLPLDGEPVCFVMPFEEGHIRLTTWIDNVRTFNLMKHNEALEAGMRDLGLANARIGCELGREQHLKFSYNDFNDLKAQLPEASFVDAADILLRLRMVKSPAEVERIRTAAGFAARALNEVFSAVKPGMSNIEIAHSVRSSTMAQGGETLPSLRVFSEHNFIKEGKVSVPTPRRIEVGDTLTVDMGTTYKGYTCDVARTAVVGRASQEQRDMYKFVIDLNRTCYEMFRPGNLCEDVVLTCQKELERVGQKPQSVGRIGHAIGAEALEYPSLAVGEKVPFEPGMVFACNPNFVTEYGFFNVEEDLVVTEDGYELIPDPLAPQELRELG